MLGTPGYFNLQVRTCYGKSMIRQCCCPHCHQGLSLPYTCFQFKLLPVWEPPACQAQVIIPGLVTRAERGQKYALPSFILRMNLVNFLDPHSGTFPKQWTKQTQWPKGICVLFTWLLRHCAFGFPRHQINLFPMSSLLVLSGCCPQITLPYFWASLTYNSYLRSWWPWMSLKSTYLNAPPVPPTSLQTFLWNMVEIWNHF